MTHAPGARSEEYDAIVVGVGGMGSAAAYHLANGGWRVLGLEQFDIPHDRGSSHGDSRIIRLAYEEGTEYVPLVRRAYELWEDLDAAHDSTLLHVTGSVSGGARDSDVFVGARRSCEQSDIDHEVLDGATLCERFPGFDVPSEWRAVYQPDGGFLIPEQCIVAHVRGAQNHGAEIRARERVLDWRPDGDGVVVETDRGEYRGRRLVVTAGAWASKLLDELVDLATPTRQTMGWFQPADPARFTPQSFPVFVFNVDDAEYYGFPEHAAPGVKVGRHDRRDDPIDPDDGLPDPTREDERELRRFTDDYLRECDGPTMRLASCMYTNSPDEDFIVDVHPDHSQVVLAAGFSGHGFKFASVVGEILADLAIEGETDHEIGSFRLDRF